MDLAIIPINHRDALHWNKPENKLLMLWQIGIPALTSNTPAYTRVMNSAGLPYLCHSEEEWIKKIEGYQQASATEREKDFNKTTAYLQAHHTKEIILEKWDKIFESVL